MNRRVLCYAPYTMWQIHALWETTLLHALRLRGAEVRHVFCDGVYPLCDINKAINPRGPHACLMCQKAVTDIAYALRSDFRWLGRYLMPDEPVLAREWAAAIPDHDLLAAEHEGVAVGAYVTSSVHTHFRRVDLDFDDPEVVRVARAYVEGGFLAVRAFTRLLDDFDPDVLLLFNGRMASLRILLEMAQARGIPVYVHERGRRRNTLRFHKNEGCFGNRQLAEMQAQWGDIPLIKDEIKAIERELVERSYGRTTNYASLRPTPPQVVEAVADRLDLAMDRPLWLVLPSSEDEYAGHPEFYPTFPGIYAWCDAIVAFARDHPELDFVVRAHPNMAASSAFGANEQQIAYFDDLRKTAPPNLRVVMPQEKVSTYTLMDLAAVGLVLHSTTGYEMTARGIRTISGGSPRFDFLPYVADARSPEAFRELLEAARTTPPRARDAETRRLGCRFAYRYYLGLDLPMPMIEMTGTVDAKLAYASTGELAPGRWPSLDKACRVILEDEPYIDPPGAAERARDDADERRWFGLESATRQ